MGVSFFAERKGENLKTAMRRRAYMLGLCLFASATCSFANEEEGVAFSISTSCVPAQIGNKPANLTESLIEGYNYGCYKVANKALRWHTEDGIPQGMLEFSNTNTSVLLVELKVYAMQTILFMGPLAAFVILSTLYCSFWSCGMMKCCAENRKCFGKCCANPPRCTEGSCEYLLFLLIIGAGVTVVGLALKGLTSNTQQNEAVTKIASSFELMETWGSATAARTDELKRDFADVRVVTDALVVSLGSLLTTEIQADAETAADNVLAGMAGATDAVTKLTVELTALNDEVSNMTTSFSESTNTFNTYRGKVMLFAWIGLCGLMMWGIMIAIVRQLAPSATENWCCGVLVNFVGFNYLLILFLLGIVCIVLSILSIFLGDVCQEPDSQFGIIISSLSSSGADIGTTETSSGSGYVESSGDTEAALGLGVDSFLYYLDCDTNTTSVNPFNMRVEETAEMVYSAAGGSAELGTIFDIKQADVESSLANCTATPPPGGCGDIQTAYINFFHDKTAVQDNLASLSIAMDVLKFTVMGSQTTTISSASDIVVPNQGLSDGLFSAVQCYQLNSRYHAMVNVFCDDVFSSIAMTLEFLLIALVLMVMVEWLKRLARPYNGEYDMGRIMPAGGDKWALAKGRDEYSRSSRA